MSIIDDIIKPEIRSLPSYVAGKMPQPGPDGRCIKLASNENLFGTSQAVLEAMNTVIRNGLTIYPDSSMRQLRESAVRFWAERGVQLTSGQFLFGNGSGEVLNMILASVIRQGDRLVVPELSFSLYTLLSVPKGADVNLSGRKNYEIDLENLLDLSTKGKKARAVIIANPDNPVSSFIEKEKLISFMDSMPADILVIIDEAYIHFAGLENSLMDHLNKYPNLVIAHTFSKAYGMAALRVGYAVMAPELSAEMEKIRLPFNMSTLQQAGAAAAFDSPEALYSVPLVIVSRDFMFHEIKNMGFAVKKPYGNFIFVDFGDKCEEIYTLLENNGISVRILSSFGYPRNFCRITAGTMADSQYLVSILKKSALDAD